MKNKAVYLRRKCWVKNCIYIEIVCIFPLKTLYIAEKICNSFLSCVLSCISVTVFKEKSIVRLIRPLNKKINFVSLDTQLNIQS